MYDKHLIIFAKVLDLVMALKGEILQDQNTIGTYTSNGYFKMWFLTLYRVILNLDCPQYVKTEEDLNNKITL